MSTDLKLTQDQLDRALDAAEVGRWHWRADTNAFEGDRITHAIVGTWPGMRTRVTYGDAIREADRARWHASWQAACVPSGTGIYDCAFRLVRPSDGQIRWLTEAGQVFFRDGKATHAFGIVRDMTNQQLESAAVEDLATRLAGIVSISTDAIISMDEQQTITMFNDGAERIFGFARAEVLGRPLTMLLPDQHRAAHAAHVVTFGTSSVPARRMSERSEIFGQRKSGETFPAEASISKIDVDGRRVYTAVLRDITERKQSQALLQRRVEEATQELRLEMKRREESQAQLVRTQRMEAFGQLTGGIAHDFNNLLTVIMGNLELIEMRVTDEKSKVLLQRAQDAAGMGSRLTARLLTFARRRRFEALPLNINEHVIGMAELLERTLGEQITLTTSLQHEPWTIVADASEVENAILNLAINARDAMPMGGKLIIETANVLVDTARMDVGGTVEPGDYVRLTVSDTGTGMAPEVLQHAMEPFFTTKDTGKGTGLGLSTIYGFVQQSKGTITIYSEVGQGTSVSLYLPRAERKRGGAVAPAHTTEIPVGRGERVLVVEDNADVRAVTTAQLESLGYTVTTATNGPEAIELLGGNIAFALVFSDVVMPGGLTGFDVAAWVGTNRKDAKMLLTSGYPGGVLDQAQTPSVEILRKPFNRAELAQAVRRALSG